MDVAFDADVFERSQPGSRDWCQTAPEVKCGLSFEIGDVHFLHIRVHVHIVYMELSCKMSCDRRRARVAHAQFVQVQQNKTEGLKLKTEGIL